MDSERATTKPRKFLQVGEDWKWRMSDWEVIFLEGVWKWKGGEIMGTFWDWGTGVRIIACWIFWGFGGRFIAGARMGR